VKQVRHRRGEPPPLVVVQGQQERAAGAARHHTSALAGMIGTYRHIASDGIRQDSLGNRKQLFDLVVVAETVILVGRTCAIHADRREHRVVVHVLPDERGRQAEGLVGHRKQVKEQGEVGKQGEEEVVGPRIVEEIGASTREPQ